MSIIRAACIQMRSSDVVADNIAAACTLIREAAAAGARLIATPEMTSLLDRRPGAVLAKACHEKDDPALHAFCGLAKSLSVRLIIGSLPIKTSETKCANRSFYITSDGSIGARYDKIHMFDVQLRPGEEYRESERYDAGDTFELVSDHAIRVGLTICYDMRFPEGYRSLAREGAEVIAIPSSFTETTGTAHWHVLTRARAIESGCFILAPAQGGKHADGRETYGHSLIIDPWGRVLAEAGTEPCVIHADLDLDQVEAARARIPSLRHDRRYTIHHSRLRVPLDRND